MNNLPKMLWRSTIDKKDYNGLCRAVMPDKYQTDSAYTHEIGVIIENGAAFKSESSDNTALTGVAPFETKIYYLMRQKSMVLISTA